MNAMTMNCYSCGAAVRNADPACGHCGARLATVSCPACFGMMFQEARFCPACGSPAAQWEAGAAESPCPCCQTPMLHGQLNGVHLDECPKCYGLWLDKATFDHICRNAEKQAAALGAAQAFPPASGIAPVRYRPCPRCRDLMHRINFAKRSGVIVDACRVHGTWFDANELHHIVQFIRAGGMEKARDREKQELADERRRIEASRRSSDPVFTPGHASAFPPPDLLSEVVSATGEIVTWWMD